MERLKFDLDAISFKSALWEFLICGKRKLDQREKWEKNLKSSENFFYFLLLSLQADKLKAYRFCDNVWTFVMENVEFRDVTQPVDGVVDRVKIVACDASAAKLAST